jgi:hypothetical protein
VSGLVHPFCSRGLNRVSLQDSSFSENENNNLVFENIKEKFPIKRLRAEYAIRERSIDMTRQNLLCDDRHSSFLHSVREAGVCLLLISIRNLIYCNFAGWLIGSVIFNKYSDPCCTNT